MNADYELIDNEEKKQYQIVVGEFKPKIEYIKTTEKIYLTHTEVPVELEGKGIGAKMVKMALEDIEQRGLLLIPLCPFVAAYIKRHPEWAKVLDGSVNIK